MKKRVLVGMSGGVDSSVAAYLLKEEGYEVIGVTMQIWQDEERAVLEEKAGCCGISAVLDARRVAEMLDIPYYVLNFKDSFQKNVIDYFIHEYQAGRTPNPCIACNRMVKWESLFHKAMELQADYLATGHYATIEKYQPTGRYALKKSAAIGKDQTYALYSLTQAQIAHTLMPLGHYQKESVRKIAQQIGLAVANKPDSQEICFIPDNDYGKYLEEHTKTPILPGDFLDVCGNVLGKHRGIPYYTVGQRKGLGIAFGKPMFVKKIDAANNQIILAENSQLFEEEMRVSALNFVSYEKLNDEEKLYCKIRYSHQPAACKVKIIGDQLHCRFEEPQRAITPGQAAVFYQDDFVAFGGVIV